MLYDTQMKSERKQWFQEWLENNSEFHQSEILTFHQSTDKGTEASTLKMKRPFVETVSVTSVEMNQEKLSMRYLDLTNDSEENTLLEFS